MLADRYDFETAEKECRPLWARTLVYAWNPDEPKENAYIIDTPPPTVSGYLHIGHVYSYTQTDLTARYMRMSGRNVFYPIGFDDNGLPTERLVETKRKIRAVDMSREEFTKICHEVVEESEDEFRELFNSIALSVDWKQEYRTISPSSIKISQMSALDLFHKDHLYRKLQPSLWDPVDRTALAQAEIVDKEQSGVMWEIAFELEGGGDVTIGTTRPELLGACCALFIHPDHPRAGALLGRTAISPLFRVPIPVLADERADPEKGTGVVMCCTFGDTTDIDWWRDHKLPTRVILDKQGRLTGLDQIGSANWPSLDIAGAQAAAEQLSGLYVKAARERTIALLREKEAVRAETEITRMVPSAERSGAPLEILVTPQWFVSVVDKKDILLQRGREVNWYPHSMLVRYERWVENLRWDWCVSRQRYFGVPFPFWYSKRPGEEGKIIPAHVDDLPVNPLVDLPRGYGAHEVEPDPDVMDTWATSSVSPQINGQGIQPDLAIDLERYGKLFPATLRPQAHEIIRTWAFYTIVKTHLHANTIPWRDITISGWCLAQDRTKMSKSKGNVVLPGTLIKQYGADVVRYWTATSRLGLDTALSEDVLKLGKRLTNKLWNFSRYVDQQLQNIDGTPASPKQDTASGDITETLDLWILSRLSETITTATELYEKYEYADALHAIESFFWKDLCDNYVELTKARVYGDEGSAAGRKSAQYTLWHSLDSVLRLFAPTLPFISETIHRGVFGDSDLSIHRRGNWPLATTHVLDARANGAGEDSVLVLAAIRKAKSERQVSVKAPIRHLTIALAPNVPQEARSAIETTRGDLMAAAGVATLSWADTLEGAGVTNVDDRYLLQLEFETTDA